MSAQPVRAVGGWPKRVIDIAISVIGLVLLAPLMLIVAAGVKLTMGGPVIFTQRRVGLGGAVFECRKFRTMIVDSEAVLARHLAANPNAAHEWGVSRKLIDDPRVTWLGNVLRKSSIDELPQLINILKGDMSCVGPRPVMIDELERYGAHVGEYLSARPGLTGLWQVSGRNRLSYDERVRLDAHYVKSWSLREDARILVRTLPAVLAIGETA